MKATYMVWRIGTTGEYDTMLKEYATFSGARNRARREADSEYRSGVRFIVSKNLSSGPLSGEKKADEIGMGGVEYNGSPEFEAEV